MGSLYYPQLIAVLVAAGVECGVIDINEGWERRSRSSGGFDAPPLGVCWHHTASVASVQADLNWMINGSGDAPIGNLLLDRDGVVWPIAAGAANTQGKGGPENFSRGTVPVDQGNTRMWGMEVANDGTGEVWPQAQIDAYFKTSNALNAMFGNLPTDCVTHHEYAPDRKIDPAVAWAVTGAWEPGSVTSSGTWSGDDIRSECARRGALTPPTPTPQEDEVEVVEVAVTGANARFLGHRVRQATTAVDGSVGERVFLLWAEWVDGTDPLQLARLEAYRNLGVPLFEVPDLSGVGLIGPIPTGDSLRQWSRADFGNVV